MILYLFLVYVSPHQGSSAELITLDVGLAALGTFGSAYVVANESTSTYHALDLVYVWITLDSVSPIDDYVD